MRKSYFSVIKPIEQTVPQKPANPKNSKKLEIYSIATIATEEEPNEFRGRTDFANCVYININICVMSEIRLCDRERG